MVGNEPGQLYLSFLIIENHLEFAHALVLDPAKEWLESLAPASLQELISFSVIPLTDSLICLGGCWNLYKFTCSFSLTWKAEESHKHRRKFNIAFAIRLICLPSSWHLQNVHMQAVLDPPFYRKSDRKRRISVCHVDCHATCFLLPSSNRRRK